MMASAMTASAASSSVIPNTSRSTCSVCWPNTGAGKRWAAVVALYSELVTGVGHGAHLQVQAQPQLRSVELPKELGAVAAGNAIFEWTGGTQDIQGRGRFDPDRSRAVVGQILDRSGSDGYPRNIKHLESVEGQRHCHHPLL